MIEGPEKRFFQAEYLPKIRHSEPGLLSMVSLGEGLIGSQFFFTLGSDQTSLDGIHLVIGQVVEGLEVLRSINEIICDNTHRPYKDVRITHTVILDDPFPNPRGFREVSRSPSPSAERLRGGRIAADEEIDDAVGKTEQELAEMRLEREAKARATILEIIGDLPDAEIAPPENVLFVCKLNSVTTDDDLEIIFSRFGKIKGCEVIRDRKSGDSLQYAFIEFEDKKSCEMAYFKMDNVLIDDRRIHVDFSQSVSKMQWRGKGRGFIMKDGSNDNRLDFNNYNKPIRGNNRNFNRNDRNDRNERYDRNGRNDRNDRNRNEKAFNRQNDDRRNRSPKRYQYDRQERRRSRSRSPYNRRRERSNERFNERKNERNAYGRDRSPVNRNDRRDERYNDRRRNEVQQRNERDKRTSLDRKEPRRDPSIEKKKSHETDKKSQKKSKKSKSKKDKKHKKKKTSKKHKKHSSTDSSSDSESSSNSRSS